MSAVWIIPFALMLSIFATTLFIVVHFYWKQAFRKDQIIEQSTNKMIKEIEKFLGKIN